MKPKPMKKACGKPCAGCRCGGTERRIATLELLVESLCESVNSLEEERTRLRSSVTILQNVIAGEAHIVDEVVRSLLPVLQRVAGGSAELRLATQRALRRAAADVPKRAASPRSSEL